MSTVEVKRASPIAIQEEGAQATVEMAVVVPVMIVMAMIVYNLAVFMAATARFDRVAPDIVLAHGVAPVSDNGEASEGVSAVATQLEQAMEGYDVEIEVECQSEGEQEGAPLLGLVGSLRTYRCVMRYQPWPSGLSIAGVSMGAPVALMHERSVTVDPWRPGVIM